MKLADIQALRPTEGADSSAIAAALATTTTERQAAADRQRGAEAIRADPMAHERKVLAAAATDAEEARFDVERFDILIPLLRADLDAARGRETVAELREQARALEPLAERVREWQRDSFPKIAELVSAGLHAQHELSTATADLIARTQAEYLRPEVRDAGALGVGFPELSEPLPTTHFREWERVR